MGKYKYRSGQNVYEDNVDRCDVYEDVPMHGIITDWMDWKMIIVIVIMVIVMMTTDVIDMRMRMRMRQIYLYHVNKDHI